MGFCRLSIIDLSEKGKQPMPNEDGQVIITFNGEIYNYLDLRAELIGLGHEFRSRTDTEVLVHLYEEYGPDMMSRIDGMFAFVIYDRRRQEIFGARDRFGQKPFYYALTPSGLFWSSEFRTLAMLVPVELHEDLQGFYHYVSFNCYPREFTHFREIRKLLPGHQLKFRVADQALDVQRYYRLTVHHNTDSHQERVERIRDLFAKAVKKRLMSDVPLGFYLSGGIDSSGIVMQAAQFESSLNTFSIAMEGDPSEYDETPFARLVAERSGANHHETRLSESEYAAYIRESIWALDEPVNLPDAALLNHMTKAAADMGVKVLMSGEGGDEVFFGYTHYWPHIEAYYRYEMLYDLLPKRLRDISRSALRRLSPRRFDRVHRWLRGRVRFLGENTGLTDAQKNRYLAQQVLESPQVRELSENMSIRLHRELGISDREHLSKPIMLHEFDWRLPDLLLMRIDKITMANSVEARNPFLDWDLVEYASGIPFDELYDGRLGKVALREALGELLPNEIAGRGKVGFGGSAINMAKPQVVALLREIIWESDFLDEYYDPEFLDWVTSLPGNYAHWTCYALWNAAMFGLWKGRLDRLLAKKAPSLKRA
jgi:asparagine synthase (glutamine-hydrolysing)